MPLLTQPLRAIAQNKLESTTSELQTTKTVLDKTSVELEETNVVLGAHEEKHVALRSQATDLQQTLAASVADVGGLWSKIGRKASVEETNSRNLELFEDAVGRAVGSLCDQASQFEQGQGERASTLQSGISEFVAVKQEVQQQQQQQCVAASYWSTHY